LTTSKGAMTKLESARVSNRQAPGCRWASVVPRYQTGRGAGSHNLPFGALILEALAFCRHASSRLERAEAWLIRTLDARKLVTWCGIESFAN
jgi:hypothetical protein